VVLWRLRYKRSLRDRALIRGFVFNYEAVRDWEAKLMPALAEDLRRRRMGKVSRSWIIDETYIRVQGGGWKYLHRAIDHDGALFDVMLSGHCDLAAAKAFLRSAKTVTGVTPDRVTTDGRCRTRMCQRVPVFDTAPAHALNGDRARHLGGCLKPRLPTRTLCEAKAGKLTATPGCRQYLHEQIRFKYVGQGLAVTDEHQSEGGVFDWTQTRSSAYGLATMTRPVLIAARKPFQSFSVWSA
jgi:hypothetical protein